MSRRVIAGRSLALRAKDRRRRCTMACALISPWDLVSLGLGAGAWRRGVLDERRGGVAPTSAGPYGSMLACLRRFAWLVAAD
jgi:hypothetical protein